VRPMGDEEEPTKYGEGDYWDDRYGTWAQDPYDWLWEWKDLAEPIAALVSTEDRVLVPGCGNAPFSPDMYDAGFTEQLNFDTSDVVIEQCKERNISRPKMKFEVMDACKLPLPDASFEAIVDKSLIDTLRCCTGSSTFCKDFIDEMHRVLTPQGVFIALSLNSYTFADIIRYYDRSEYNWAVAWVNLPNPSYDPETENSETYTFIVCSRAHEQADLQLLLERFESDEQTAARTLALNAELQSVEEEAED